MLDFIFSQYNDYQTHDIILEVIAVIMGIASVWFAKKNNILVFPSGLISTLIFVYLLYKWELLGDMLINIYYSSMSIYGWYLWSRKNSNTTELAISGISTKEKTKTIFIFFLTIVFVILVYKWFTKFNNWTAYLDTFTTGIFFVGMWLMAKRKVENWIFWIIGDFISIPLYWYKGLIFTSLQFFIFTIIAIYAYKEWKTYLPKTIINK